MLKKAAVWSCVQFIALNWWDVECEWNALAWSGVDNFWKALILLLFRRWRFKTVLLNMVVMDTAQLALMHRLWPIH